MPESAYSTHLHGRGNILLTGTALTSAWPGSCSCTRALAHSHSQAPSANDAKRIITMTTMMIAATAGEEELLKATSTHQVAGKIGLNYFLL